MHDERILILGVMISGMLSVLTVIRMSLQHIRFQRLARLQSETVSKVLDKLGSSPETLEWLRSGDMKRFFDFQLDQEQGPQNRILNALTAGLITGSLGAGLITLGASEQERVLHGLGMVLVCVGSGFLLSAAASYLLSKQWGLLEHRGRD